jgi:hypothetical protein
LKGPLYCLAALAALGLALAPTSRAGDKDKKDNPFAGLPKPGPEHKVLAKGEGTWDAAVKAWMEPGKPPMESKGVLQRKMILGGRYLQETFKGSFAGMPFEGVGTLAYDTPKKQYVMTWIDNFGTGITVSHGTYDADKKTLTFTGEEDMPGYGKMKTRDVLKYVSDDQQLFEMYRAPIADKAKETKVMEITYTRKKS